MIKPVLGLAVVGAGVWWAYEEGHLSKFGGLEDLITKAKAALSGADANTDILAKPVLTGDDGGDDVEKVAETPAGVPAGVSARVELMRQNYWDLSAWSTASTENILFTAAISLTENLKGDPQARGAAGEFGLMQVMPATAKDLYGWGYTKYQPTAETLSTVGGNLYFGSAYLDYVASRNGGKKSKAWIARAYNGGPGWEGSSAKALAMTKDYLAKVTKHYTNLGGTTAQMGTALGSPKAETSAASGANSAWLNAQKGL